MRVGSGRHGADGEFDEVGQRVDAARVAVREVQVEAAGADRLDVQQAHVLDRYRRAGTTLRTAFGAAAGFAQLGEADLVRRGRRSGLGS